MNLRKWLQASGSLCGLGPLLLSAPSLRPGSSAGSVPVPGEQEEARICCQGGAGTGSQSALRGTLGRTASSPRSSCSPRRSTGVCRAGTRKDRDKEGQSYSHRVAAGRGRWWPPASGDSPGQLSRVPGTAPREGGFGVPSPLPKSRPRFAHAALPPRRGDWSTGSSHPFWKFYQPDFEVFLRCAAWGALQGPVKSGDPPVCTYIFIQSGSVLLQD